MAAGRKVGFRLTAAMKQRLSDAHKGQRAWNKGVPCSEEQKSRLRLLRKGTTISAAHKAAIKSALTGRKRPFLIGVKQSKEHVEKKVASIRARFDVVGRKTPDNKRARNSQKYQTWRDAVFERDDWTCQKCHSKGEYLQAHHVEDFASNEHLRFEVDNGITFCRPCHKLFHHLFGRYGSTAKYKQQFLISAD